MKKICTVLCCLLCAIALASCGSVQIDVEKTASTAVEKIKFDEKLFKVDKDRAVKTFGIEPSVVKNCASYVSSAAVVDELSVWQSSTSEGALEIKNKIDERLAAQNEVYSTYNADQLPKLKSAIIIAKGNYVIFCVSADNSAAKSILEDMI